MSKASSVLFCVMNQLTAVAVNTPSCLGWLNAAWVFAPVVESTTYSCHTAWMWDEYLHHLLLMKMGTEIESDVKGFNNTTVTCGSSPELHISHGLLSAAESCAHQQGKPLSLSNSLKLEDSTTRFIRPVPGACDNLSCDESLQKPPLQSCRSVPYIWGTHSCWIKMCKIQGIQGEVPCRSVCPALWKLHWLSWSEMK